MLDSCASLFTSSKNYREGTGFLVLLNGGSMKTRVFLVVGLILGASLANIDCRKRNLEWKGTIAEKNGIFIVKNPKLPAYPNAEFKFRQELRIGQASGKPEYLFSQIREFDVDLVGNIYVIDIKENNIRLAILAQEKQAILNQRKKLPESQRPIDFPKQHAPYLNVNNDDAGHIIVQVFSEYLEDPSKTSDSVFDIFDKEGRYLAQIRHPFKGLFEKPIIWKKGKMYTVEQDEEGYPFIVRYAVEGLASLAIRN